MNYLEWNNVIIEHFFNNDNEDKEVILYFSEEVIEEIGENNFPHPSNGYVEDFYNSLRRGVLGAPKEYIDRIKYLSKKAKNIQSIDDVPFKYPPYLTYMLSFILPFTSGGRVDRELNRNNFHYNAKIHFENKRLVANYDKQIAGRLKEINHLWDDMFNWLFETNNLTIGYIEKIDNPSINRKYVEKYEYHFVLRKDQEDKLADIFDTNDILPGDVLSEENVKNLLINNSEDLKLSHSIVRKLKNNEYIGQKLIQRTLNYFNKWDGTNHYDYSKASKATHSEVQRGYSQKRLTLCLTFNRISKKVSPLYVRAFSSDGYPEESMAINIKNKEEYSIEQSQYNPLYSTPIIDVFKNFGEAIELRDEASKIKYRWRSDSFLLFKHDKYLNQWVQISKIEHNVQSTLIIATAEFFQQELAQWFKEQILEENKKLLDENEKTTLPEGWIALSINSITNFQHPTIKELQITERDSIKINFDKEFYFKMQLFADILPDVWLENVEYDNASIFAVYENGESVALLRNNETKKFQFRNEHKENIGRSFRLTANINNEVIEYQRNLTISNFDNKISNEDLLEIQPRRTLFGQRIKHTNTINNYYRGLEHCFTEAKINQLRPYLNLIELKTFKNDREANNYTSNNDYQREHIGNILINYISTKAKLNKTEYNKAVAKLLQRHTIYEGDEQGITKKISSSLYALQNHGYVDYDAEEGMIYVNKSTVVIKPTETGITLILTGARDNELIVKLCNYAKAGHCYLEFKNNEELPLIPQTLFIKFKKSNHNLIRELSTHFSLQFKDGEELYTQFALANSIKIDEWKEYIKSTDSLNLASDFEGGQIFNVENLKFEDRPKEINKELSLLKFEKINGYKTVYRLWHNNSSYQISEQHYGIYLFLFLSHEKKKEELRKARDNYEISRIGYEKEMLILNDKAEILIYDKEKEWLAVPLYCGLPKYYAIAFTLLSGLKPSYKYMNDNSYLIYKNIPSLFAKNTLENSLKQKTKDQSIN